MTATRVFKILVSSKIRMEEWVRPNGSLDSTMKLLVATSFFIWNVFEGSLFHTPYPAEWVYLFKFPYWRILLVLLVIVSAAWSPHVGVLVALAVFFYLGDLSRLTTPWILPIAEVEERQ